MSGPAPSDRSPGVRDSTTRRVACVVFFVSCISRAVRLIPRRVSFRTRFCCARPGTGASHSCLTIPGPSSSRTASARTAQAQERPTPLARRGRPGRYHRYPEVRHPVGDASPGREAIVPGHHLLAPPTRRQAARGWNRLHQPVLVRLGEADRLDCERACLASASVPAPRGRCRRPQRDTPCTKHHLVSGRPWRPDSAMPIGMTTCCSSP